MVVAEVSGGLIEDAQVLVVWPGWEAGLDRRDERRAGVVDGGCGGGAALGKALERVLDRVFDELPEVGVVVQDRL